MNSKITDYLVQRAGGMIKEAPEVSDNENKYFMFDDGGVEGEVGEFLYGLVRVLKPKRVLTTGIYTGISDMYIGQGLVDNGFGASTALEVDMHHINRARELWKKAGVSEVITSVNGESLKFQPEGQYELMFLDSEPHLRFKELVRFYDFIAPGGFIFIHDLHEHFSQEDNKEHGFGWPFNKLPIEIVQMFQQDKLRAFHFPTPRGFTGMYKLTERTYRYER